MKRRVVAKKNMPASFRAWVKNFEGKGLVGSYRKHYHVSWSCAIVELAMMGVSFPPEQLEEAKRKQVGAIQSTQGRRARKSAAMRLLQSEAYSRRVSRPDDDFAPVANNLERLCVNFDCTDDLEEPDWSKDLDSPACAGVALDYDPFADD